MRPRPLFVLRTRRQVKAFSDPLRVRILELLIREPMTTLQVAMAFGMGRHRLYHHVRILEREGCVVLVRTRKKRGTIEKYYRAVARRFVTDPALFPGAAAGRGAGSTHLALVTSRARMAALTRQYRAWVRACVRADGAGGDVRFEFSAAFRQGPAATSAR